MKQTPPRSRPTNNQLLYKAHFRWEHCPHRKYLTNLPKDTEPCASVTAAFLKVLGILQQIENARVPKRNILQILANNTRRTKVLELSSGTHRIPEELKKHYLTDENGAQYSTNLDRNRYGNDNNYLFTVIKHDLETLGLCPRLVDVEIIDAKANGESQVVAAGVETCQCSGLVESPVPAGGAVAVVAAAHAGRVEAGNGVVEAVAAGVPVGVQMGVPGGVPPTTAVEHTAVGECSQLFDALVAAAADAEGADGPSGGNSSAEPHLTSRPRVSPSAAPSSMNAPLDGSSSPDRRGAGGSSRAGGGPGGPSMAGRLFSVNSSDLLGCGLSNLGNSCLAAADFDLDRRDEVDQGPSKRPCLKEVDTISEQGDTDKYLKDISAEAPAEQDVNRRGHLLLPRDGAMAGHASEDVRSLWMEMQSLSRNQQHTTHVLEHQKRSYIECEMQLGQAQQNMQVMQSDQAHLLAALDRSNARVAQLESSVHTMSTQLASLQHVLATVLHAEHPERNEALLQQLRAAMPAVPASAPAAAAGAPAAPTPAMTAAAPEPADRRGVANGTVRNLEVQNGTAAAGAAGEEASLKGRSAPAVGCATGQGVREQTGAAAAVAAAGSKPVSAENVGAGGLTGRLPAGELPADVDGQAAAAAMKQEDRDVLQRMPKFEKIDSLSDLGSLFSAAQGRTIDARTSAHPTHTTVSISSPPHAGASSKPTPTPSEAAVAPKDAVAHC